MSLKQRFKNALRALGGAYEAATTGRRGSNWVAPSGGPNASLTYSLPLLRNRSRAAFRNNPLISLGLKRGVSNEIGTGVVPRFLSEDEGFKKSMSGLFDDWAELCDPEQILNYYGLQTQMCRARRVSGECFVRRRRRSLSFGLPIPLQLQVLESEYVPADKTEKLKNGNTIKAGIEFNKKNQRVAYWMYTAHPGERDGFESNQLIRVPARDVIHHFEPTRPGQLRGEPEAVASLLKAHTFDTYDDAELTRKQTRAPYTGFLTRDSWTEDDYKFDPFTGDPVTSSSQVPELSVQAGTILTGLPGEQLKLFDGDDTGAGYADFMREQKLSIAAGLGVPYELLTGDWSKINDRLYRALINEYRRQVEALQDQITIYQCCRVVVNWAIESAVISGSVKASKYFVNRADYHKVEHRPQGWKYINPQQDIQAALLAIDGNLESRDRNIAERGGWDAEEVDKQNVEAEKRLAELRKKAGLSEPVES